jgi:hypothetical protein
MFTSTGSRCNYCVHVLATGQIYSFQLFEMYRITASCASGVHELKSLGTESVDLGRLCKGSEVPEGPRKTAIERT